MKEELQIKIKVDTSSVTTTLNKLKNEVRNAGLNSNSIIGQETVSQTNAATQTITKSLTAVQDKINKIKGMSLIDVTAWLSGLFVIETQGDKIAKELSEKFKDVKFVSSKELMKQLPPEFIERWKELSKSIRYANREARQFKLPTSFKELGNMFKQLGSKIGSTIGGAFSKLGSGVKSAVQGIGNGIKNIPNLIKGIPSAMGKAGGAVAKFGASFANLLPIIAGFGSVIVVAIGALGALMGVVAAFKVSKLGDEIYHNAQRFGMSSDAFQEWSYIMEQTGGTIEDLTGFMETLASEQAAVIEGSEDAAANFKRLGLSMEEVSGMRQQELFEETVKRIQQIGDATQRSAIAYSIFGDEASKFMNVLNMSNGDIEKAIQNYHLLGGAMSGDLLEKSNSLQSSIHNMKQAWQGVSNALAEVFIPIVQVVVRWLTKAFVAVNLFIRSLFGLDLKGKTGGAMDGATSSTNKYAASTKAATKAAEQLKRTTMGFDELNIVSNPQSGAADSASSPSMGGGMGGLDTGLLDASSLNLEGLYAWFEKYKTLIRDILAWSMLIIGVIGGVIMLLSGNIIGSISLFAMAGIGLAIGSGEGGTWDRFLSKHKGLADALKVVWEVFKEVLVGVWTVIWENVKFCAKTIYDAFLWAWEVVKAITVPIIDFFKAIWHSIEAIFAVVEAVFTGSWGKAWEAVKKAFSSWGTFFKSLWDGVVSIFSATVTFFGNMFKNAWSAIKNVFAGWGDFFKRLWDTIKSIFGNIATSIGNTIVAIVKGAINGIFSMIENKINFFVDALNGAISLINKIPGVNLSKLSRFKIPRLAEGGIATSSTIANIGEAGKEAILPLENNTEWMDTLASKIAERNAGPSKIVLQVGEKELGWAAINGINGITKQTGNIQLAL